MCAISGLLSLGENPVDIEALRRMSATMHHRGPDGRGAVSFGRCGLAHERLAIVDLQTGSQPLLSEDGRTAAVVNGEIYNHADLRTTLQARGHHFSSQSDSEVVVHGFEEFGFGIFERLHGMFAIALWDDARRTLVLARDGLGKKPLCFTWLDRGRLAFASELRAFHAHADFRPRLRRRALAEFLGYRCVEDPGSIYENVSKVPAGEWLAIGPDGSERRGVHWSLPTVEPLVPYDRRREAELSRELRERVGLAVRRRLMSDVPVGILLSGGIDSTVVAYEAARQCPAIRTFTLGFAGADDECDIARATAHALGTQHTEHRIDLDPKTAMTAAEAAYDEPFADSSAVASVRICEAARQHVSVVLNGDGGDEAFAGYPRAQLLAKRWRDVPPWLLRHLLKLRLKVGTDRSRARALDHQRIRKAMREHSGDFERWRALLWVFSPAEVGSMTGSPAPLEGPASCTFAYTEADDYRFFLRSDLLVKMDRASMHVGLEARSPLLDTDVIDLSRGLDVGWKLRGATTKYLLRRAYRDLLPSHIWSLRKRGFAAPTKKWLATALRQEVSDLARDKAQPVYQVLDFAAVQDATEHMRGYHQKVWSVLMLNRWLAREAARVRA